ncbi:MAG: HAMP domain-containing sensor histidine kinase [Chloroflexota bacterium]
MSKLPFRTRLLLSYLLIILMASGIVYFVSVSQIRAAETGAFNDLLISDADDAKGELEDFFLETSQDWMCDQIDLFSPEQRESLEIWFELEIDGQPFSCDQLWFNACFAIAEELDLNEPFESEHGEEDVELFCEQQTAYFESDAFEQELADFFNELVEDWDHLLLWDVEESSLVYENGNGPSINLISIYFGDDLFEETISEPIEFEETGESIVYIGRNFQFEEVPFLYFVAGRANSDIEITAQVQALRIAVTTAIVGTLFLSIIAFRMANTLAKPLTELRNSAQAMAAGELSTRAETSAPPEIRDLAEDFNQMAASVESMVIEQRAFAQNAAHELRTPLTAMRIRTEALLEDEPDEDTQNAYISEIHLEIERLTRLVEDLRLLSRADAQNLAVGDEEVNLINLVNALLREFSRPIAEKELSTELLSQQELFIVKAGATHMRVALRNVIENGIKYTPTGGEISIDLKNEKINGKDCHQIIVRDTGIGIPAEDLPNLTKRFFRVDKAHNRGVPGSGLGLSLVGSIVELYGGELIISSEGVGEGTEVTILLPYRA